MNRLQLKLGLWLLCLLFVTHGAWAQTSSGTIVGTVTDPTGAAIPDATVTAVSKDTGEKKVAKTNSVGGYRIESVTPGVFDISAEAPNFQKTTTENIRVVSSKETSVNESLGIGKTSVTVEVAGDQATLDTDTGTMSGTLNSVAINNLPVGDLNPYALAETLPGVQVVSSQNSFSEGDNFSVNGARSRANNFLIEGSDNNDAGIHGSGITPENLDAIEEVVLLENSYQAEFGGGGGSVANLIYKNGSNHFHGAVWERLFNSSLNASDKSNFYTGQTKSKTRENIYGYDIGGYAIKDKLFFFNSLQFDHFNSSTQSTLIVPTATGVATLQSLLPNPRIAQLLQAIGSNRGTDDPTSVNFSCLVISEATTATAACPASSVAVGAFVRSIPANTTTPELDNKVEYIPTQKDTLIFRYIRTHNDAPFDTFNFPSQLPGFDTTQSGETDNAGITYTHTFTPNLLNDLRISYGRIAFLFDFQPATYANPLGTAPTITITNGANSEITGYGAPSGDPQSRSHNTYQLQDALTWNIRGRHSLKAGFDVADIRVRDAVPFNLYGSVTYNSSLGTGISGLGDFIDDFGGDGPNGVAAIDIGNPIARPQLYHQAYYVQDDWKFSQNLTIQLGFRYQYDGAPFNSVAFPAFDINNPACTAPGVDVNGVPQFCKVQEVPDKSDYGPRFGFAYTPGFLSKKTVLRGGFGMFYDGLFTNIIDNTQASSPNMAAPELISDSSVNPRGTANFSTAIAGFNHSPQLQDLIESMKPNITSPRVLQWNLNVQQDLGHGFISQVGYVGTRSEHLYATDEANTFLAPISGDRLFNELGRVLIRGNGGDSIYHSAQVEIKRDFHAGFQMRAAYTWSKFEDDVSEIFTAGNASQFATIQEPFASRKSVDYGLSALDQRHRLVISYVYQPPTWHAEGAMKIAAAIVNGFQISGVQQFNSGNPGNVEAGFDANGDGISNDRPSLSNPQASVQTFAIDRSLYDGGPAGRGFCDGPNVFTFGTCVVTPASAVHWIVPAVSDNGNSFLPVTPVVQRNSFRTLGNQQADLSIQRNFHIWEGHNFLFRAESFNVLNQGTTGIPNLILADINANPAVFGPNTFGQFAPTVAGHRNLRFYAKYSF
jgi:hypothetical protein